MLLIAFGFLLSKSAWSLWTIGTLVVVAVLYLAGLALAYRSGRIAPGVLAVLVSTTVVVAFGALLTIRLVVLPDPNDPREAALWRSTIGRGWDALGKPLLALVLLAVALAVARRLPPTPLLMRIRAGAGRVRKAATAPGPGGKHGRLATLVGFVLMLLLFLLPGLPGAGADTADANLYVRGVATPEYAKVVLLGVLAALVARFSHQYREFRLRTWLAGVRQVRERGGRVLPAALAPVQFVVYPLLVFGAVAVTSVVRKDFGTVISAFAGTVGVTWAATRANTSGSPWSWRLLHTLRGYWIFFLTGAALLLIAAPVAVTTKYAIGERAQVWRDPWIYRWESACVVPAAGVPAPTPPAGTVACQSSLAADTESRRSQLARSLAVIADGGLWGNGLLDRTSRVLPAGATDFVLAVVWSKLGGLVVLATGALLALLAAALARGAAGTGAGPQPSMIQLFAAGLGAMIIGQFLFVLAATVDLLPHSGITAPFLSRGGQSTLALLLGVVIVVGLSPAGPAVPAVPAAHRWQAREAGFLGPVGVIAAIVVLITLVPYPAPLPWNGLLPTAYGGERPRCAAGGPGRAAPVNPKRCSTDRVAYDRTVIDVRLGDGAVLRQQRPGDNWAPQERRTDLVEADLTGLLQVSGGHVGVLEQTYPDILFGAAPASLDRRVGPVTAPRPADGLLALTIDPELQHTGAQALRTELGGDRPRLAGAVVMIDARSGRVLALATSPPEPAAPTTGWAAFHQTGPLHVDAAQARAFDRANPGYGVPGVHGELDGRVGDPRCRPDADDAQSCRRWRYQPQAGGEQAAADQELRHYIGDDRSIAPPRPEVNRAVGGSYGLGSTFKVVIAAAFLAADPANTAASKLPAPVSITLPNGRRIDNSGGGGPCRGSEDGLITLTAALAYSCNTAFVRLAQTLRWPAIAAQAAKFGLYAGPDCKGSRPWLAGRPLGGGTIGTCVPLTSLDVAIGNNALGGQDVHGNPLGLATVLAAVANGGTAVQPSLVTSVRDPATGRVTNVPAPELRTALSPQAAAELRTALRGTADYGTARGLNGMIGTELFVKTGTHDVTPPERFVHQYSWLAGFVPAEGGPIAFAVLVETRDQAPGAQRARYVIEQLCRALLKRR